MTEPPIASIVIPTRGRPGYLDVALASLAPQARLVGAELIVVSDGPDHETAAVAERHGATLLSLPAARGANAARNAGAEAAAGGLIVFVDDDVEAPAGWLQALLAAARDAPDREVFGGPIRARLEGRGPRACGREPTPITTLDLGPADRDAPLVWSANMAIRRTALERIGALDETIQGRGEEEEWERRYLAAGGRIRYVASAGLDHRRARADATIPALSRAAYRLGRSARRYDARKGTAPAISEELRTLTGCIWHTVSRRCGNGVVMAAEAAGRVREAIAAGAPPPSADGDVSQAIAAGATPPSADGDDFLSGTSGLVLGLRATSRARVADALADSWALATGRRWRLRRAAARWPRRRVLVVGIERAGAPNLLAAARAELLRSRHEVEFASATAGGRGKWENVDELLQRHPPAGRDWLLIVDDDVALPSGFLDVFLFLSERFQLRLAQPAHRARSHAAWQVTRRRVRSVVRETSFVEGGPVLALDAFALERLLPFPRLRYGWGLDNHLSALARAQGWRIGIVDATPVAHGLRQIASAYDRRDAIEEARRFLAGRPYVTASEAQRTLILHRSWG